MAKVSYVLAEISIVISDHFTETMNRVRCKNMEFLYFHREVIRDEMDSKLPVTEVRWRNNRCSTLAITINPCSPCPKRDSWLLIIAVGLSIGMGHMRPMVMMEISRLHCLHGPNI